ncbi:MlaD family protein [Rhodococcus gannanensis]|uniref:MlaD family protein n=1 Tax=Rhodococcus gannanensis TaxID=1960308 RepID=A0ABW4P8M0_9NOCA
MPNRFETDGRGPSERRLIVTGLVATAVAVALTFASIAKMNGRFDEDVPATALLTDVGDGLPARSDVKFRGIIVGEVTAVEPGTGGEPNRVHLALDPEHAGGVPASVTARVVPSNVFAVSSVQLLDNGSAPPLTPGAEIPQDESQQTIQLQTALTKLRQVVAATGRIGSERTVGVLAAVAAATDRRGDDIVEAGRQLDRITRELGAVITPTGGPSTMSALSTAVHGLQNSAPDLLDALHHAVVPMRTVAEKEAALNSLLSAGSGTLSTLGTALENNTDQIIGITTKLAPVLDVVAAGSPSFTPITTRFTIMGHKWFDEFWPENVQHGRGKFMFQLTPHRMYTRADCPRYGDVEGPSCATAPESSTEPWIKENAPAPATGTGAPVSGGNVGPVGGPAEKEVLSQILGGDLTSAGELILGPLARGAIVGVTPAPEEGP